jgi:hypothetical protein
MYEARVAEESARCVSYSVNTLTVQWVVNHTAVMQCIHMTSISNNKPRKEILCKALAMELTVSRQTLLTPHAEGKRLHVLPVDYLFC